MKCANLGEKDIADFWSESKNFKYMQVVLQPTMWLFCKVQVLQESVIVTRNIASWKGGGISGAGAFPPTIGHNDS